MEYTDFANKSRLMKCMADIADICVNSDSDRAWTVVFLNNGKMLISSVKDKYKQTMYLSVSAIVEPPLMCAFCWGELKSIQQTTFNNLSI